jgi:hypothetical protein
LPGPTAGEEALTHGIALKSHRKFHSRQRKIALRSAQSTDENAPGLQCSKAIFRKFEKPIKKLRTMKTGRTPAFAALRRARQTLLAAALVGAVAFTSINAQAADPLASWNDGPAKQAILEFVKGTTT